MKGSICFVSYYYRIDWRILLYPDNDNNELRVQMGKARTIEPDIFYVIFTLIVLRANEHRILYRIILISQFNAVRNIKQIVSIII